MTLATELIKYHYYVRIQRKNKMAKQFNRLKIERDDAFQSLVDISDPENMRWEMNITVGWSGGKTSVLAFGIPAGFREDRIFEITEDEYIMRNMK